MANDTPVPGGELEQAVLRALWELESATARQLHERIGVPAGLVYTTIARVLDRLLAKRLVSRTRDANRFIYRPRLEQSVVDRARARELVTRFIGDDPHPAMAPLIDAMEAIDPSLLDALAAEVVRRRKKRGT
jgi:predicted transcriptional regulator